jgi:2-keto-3-deoxy-L-rhamnonate aldolase RhmA
MKKNNLRELLNNGQSTIGVHQVAVSPVITEVIGNSGGFDYIELVGEYADWNLKDLNNFARTVELFPGMSSMMKVEWEPRVFITGRALDAGIQNMLFTDCHSAEEVRQCIRAVRAETPEDGGIHGASLRRSVGYIVEGGSEAWVQTQRDAVCAFMIEKKMAMDNLDEILEVKGVDMVQFGPGDYSVTIGKGFDMQKGMLPEVDRAQRDMIEKALKKGVHPRVELGNFEAAREYIEMGVRHFCIGWDVLAVHQWCKQNGNGLRQLLAELK